MKRGEIFVAALVGDYAEPRPVIVVQADYVSALQSTIVCPLTTFAEAAVWVRPTIDPTPDNGLLQRSYVMIDKIGAAPPHRFRQHVGHVDARTMQEIDRALSLLLGLT